MFKCLKVIQKKKKGSSSALKQRVFTQVIEKAVCVYLFHFAGEGNDRIGSLNLCSSFLIKIEEAKELGRITAPINVTRHFLFKPYIYFDTPFFLLLSFSFPLF